MKKTFGLGATIEMECTRWNLVIRRWIMRNTLLWFEKLKPSRLLTSWKILFGKWEQLPKLKPFCGKLFPMPFQLENYWSREKSNWICVVSFADLRMNLLTIFFLPAPWRVKFGLCRSSLFLIMGLMRIRFTLTSISWCLGWKIQILRWRQEEGFLGLYGICGRIAISSGLKERDSMPLR